MSTKELVLRKGTLIVAYDGSPSSLAALRWAAKHAEQLGLSIDLVTAWEPIFEVGDTIAGGFSVVSVGAGVDSEGNAARMQAEGLMQTFSEHRPVDLQTHLVEGPPARHLIEASRHAKLLVIGSRGHGVIADLILGSVSDTCSAKAHCPVLVVHPDDAM